jgi:hypothetical protein
MINDNTQQYVDKELLKLLGRSYGSYEEWDRAREENKEIEATMRINKDGTESWICGKCGEMIVSNINGDRAKMKVGKNTKLFVRFIEMAAFCENCETFNDLAFTYTGEDSDNPDFFRKDRIRYRHDVKKDKTLKENPHEIDKYLLRLK